MKHTSKTLFKRSLCAVLIAALALTLAACGHTATPETPTTPAVLTDGMTIGEGATSFPLEVVDGEGNTITATINTTKETVGDALQELDIIQGEESTYGLYIKVVNGITADYETTGTYWAFYVDGNYAVSGVDTTAIEAGVTYTLKVEKG